MRPFEFNLPSYDGAGGLTPEQRNAVECERAMFSGVPGTGKTTVAIWRLIKGNDDLLLTYTRLLSAALSILASGKWVLGVDQWYYQKCNKAWLKDDIRDNCVLNRLRENDVSLGRVIIDEGQDIDIQFYRAIKDIATRVSVGADDAQRLYDVNIDRNALREVFPENQQRALTQNFRNLYKIYNFSRQFVPENPEAHEEHMLNRLEQRSPGGFVDIRVVNSSAAINQLIKSIIKDRGDGNIGILLSETNDVDKYSDILDELDIKHSVYHSKLDWRVKRDTEKNLMSILVTTYKSAKGLEFDTVILPEFQDANSRNNNQYYVGCTRAKQYLYLLCVSSIPNILKGFDESTYTLHSNNVANNDNSSDPDLPF